ncbi:MAG: hypothetical protein H8E40_14420 [Chloroflexi bacterium]|nr:hypothetical protein [Chloroflexota bacterium]
MGLLHFLKDIFSGPDPERKRVERWEKAVKNVDQLNCDEEERKALLVLREERGGKLWYVINHIGYFGRIPGVDGGYSAKRRQSSYRIWGPFDDFKWALVFMFFHRGAVFLSEKVDRQTALSQFKWRERIRDEIKVIFRADDCKWYIDKAKPFEIGSEASIEESVKAQKLVEEIDRRGGVIYGDLDIVDEELKLRELDKIRNLLPEGYVLLNGKYSIGGNIILVERPLTSDDRNYEKEYVTCFMDKRGSRFGEHCFANERDARSDFEERD